MNEPLLIECPCCEGAGVTPIAVCVSKWADPADAYDEIPCSECNGTGEVLIEAETRTLEDLEFEDFVEVRDPKEGRP